MESGITERETRKGEVFNVAEFFDIIINGQKKRMLCVFDISMFFLSLSHILLIIVL